MKKILTFLLCIALIQVSNAQFGKLKKAAKKAESKVAEVTGGNGISKDEIGNGLKEALNVGVGNAVEFLSAENGYLGSEYKILLPDEAISVIKKVKRVPGFEDADKKMITLMNRAAENAANKAKPIFVSAIKKMTIEDAMNLLMGNNDAATRYLEKSTNTELFNEFMPVVQNSLDEVNATKYWNSIAKTYNRLPMTKDVDPELDRYVTNRALVGLFGLVEKKELDIRKNKSSRTTELLSKVFAKQDGK